MFTHSISIEITAAETVNLASHWRGMVRCNPTVIRSHCDFVLAFLTYNLLLACHLLLCKTDPPSAVGCRNCLVNDLDLSVKTSSGVRYPNGQNNKDSVNTVERVHFTPENNSEVRVIVAASNLATYGQTYSLAVTGCFRRQESSENELTQQQFSYDSSTGSSLKGVDFTYDDNDEEAEGSESVGVIDYQSLSMQMVDFQSLSMPTIVEEDESI